MASQNAIVECIANYTIKCLKIDFYYKTFCATFPKIQILQSFRIFCAVRNITKPVIFELVSPVFGASLIPVIYALFGQI